MTKIIQRNSRKAFSSFYCAEGVHDWGSRVHLVRPCEDYFHLTDSKKFLTLMIRGVHYLAVTAFPKKKGSLAKVERAGVCLRDGKTLFLPTLSCVTRRSLPKLVGRLHCRYFGKVPTFRQQSEGMPPPTCCTRRTSLWSYICEDQTGRYGRRGNNQSVSLLRRQRPRLGSRRSSCPS
ncbi:MAG: hypothetical protein JWQ87_265 [Candidatus Sulfotelmatobacter sp.]|nr:hypothetical protein [Candidatus Sulfotelmatobacter sp.]